MDQRWWVRRLIQRAPAVSAARTPIHPANRWSEDGRIVSGSSIDDQPYPRRLWSHQRRAPQPPGAQAAWAPAFAGLAAPFGRRHACISVAPHCIASQSAPSPPSTSRPRSRTSGRLEWHGMSVPCREDLAAAWHGRSSRAAASACATDPGSAPSSTSTSRADTPARASLSPTNRVGPRSARQCGASGPRGGGEPAAGAGGRRNVRRSRRTGRARRA